MVTHDQEEALTMADRIVVMDQGIIGQVGTPIEIYRDPATPFVADFVGTMNFLPGVVLGPRRVRIGHIELQCAGGLDGLDQGTAVTVCIRPEDLAAQDAGREMDNVASARVEELEFLGAFFRVTLVVEGVDDQSVTADFPPSLVRDLALREGADLTVVFPEDRIRVFANR
jgi:iron(III) transport system ATP-binding protein